MLALHSQYFTGEPDAATSCPSGSEGAGRRRISAMVQRTALPPYLSPFDHFVKRELRCAAYVRYVDDWLLFADDKSQLWEWKARIGEFLQSLRLVMHPRKSTVYPVSSGLPFLGWRIFPTHRRLKRDNVRDFARRFRAQVGAFRRGEITLDKLTECTRAWIAHAAHGDTYRLRGRLFQAMPIL
jgi:RNA-directed DNA polymerase